jgi:hypothetical protein
MTKGGLIIRRFGCFRKYGLDQKGNAKDLNFKMRAK